jgi:hypothetical protein
MNCQLTNSFPSPKSLVKCELQSVSSLKSTFRDLQSNDFPESHHSKPLNHQFDQSSKFIRSLANRILRHITSTRNKCFLKATAAPDLKGLQLWENEGREFSVFSVQVSETDNVQNKLKHGIMGFALLNLKTEH